MKLKTLLINCENKNNIDPFLDLDINDVTIDSRQVVPGNLFVCIKGAQVDGHDYIEQAVAAGAAAIVVEKHAIETDCPIIEVIDSKIALAHIANNFYQSPSRKLTLLGVTGSTGKTTVTHLIDEIVNQTGKRTGLMGRLYNKIGDEKFPTLNTTPDSLTTQHLLRQMVDQGVTHCAMEVSSHGLANNRVLEVDYDVAIFTNLRHDHLDFHRSMEAYFYTKSRLFMQLTHAPSTKDKLAIINIDDPYGQQLIPFAIGKIYTYGCNGKGDFQATDIRVNETGTTFNLLVDGTKSPISVNLIGEDVVYFLLAAIAACYVANIPLDSIIKILDQLTVSSNDFRQMPAEDQVTLLV